MQARLLKHYQQTLKERWRYTSSGPVCLGHLTAPLLKSLHWLPIHQRIIFKSPLFVYKCLHNQGPVYLLNCLSFYVPKRQLRSSNDYFRLSYPITRVLAGDRTFTVFASKEWNKLPVHIRQSSSTNVFKKALKTYLFP